MRWAWVLVLLLASLGTYGCSGGGGASDVDSAAAKLKKEMPPNAKPKDILKLGGKKEVKLKP